MRLYELNDEILRFLGAATEYRDEHGEFPPGAKETFAALKIAFEDKLEGVWMHIKNLQAEEDACREQRQYFDARIKTLAAEREFFEEYAGSELKGAPFKGKVGRFSWRKSEAVEVDSLVDIPALYCDVVKKPRLSEIKADLKAGADVPGARLVVRSNLQVK